MDFLSVRTCRLLSVLHEKTTKMLGNVLALYFMLFLKGTFAASLSGNRVYEDNFYYTTYNGSRVTWMMMPDDNGLVVSAVISGIAPRHPLGIRSVRFHLWTRRNPYEPEIGILDKKRLNFTKINVQRPTVFLIHGFTDTVKEPEFFTTLVEALLNHNDYNIIGVDWSGLACIPWYGQAVKNTFKVGLHTARAISAIRNLSPRNPTKIHLIAHNLGALVAGVAGRNVKKAKIERITGLDPAHIYTKDLSLMKKLTKEDADVVEVIHSSGDYLGTNEPIGHRDFYPNGGKWPQPGCAYDVADRCSPNRAYEYYAEALNSKNGFLATRCTSYDSYLKDECRDQPKIHLFNNNDAKLTGKFYFTTNSKPPFSNVGYH